MCQIRIQFASFSSIVYYSIILNYVLFYCMKKKDQKIIKLQVPLREELRHSAEDKAHEMGFGSVQEVVRLFLAGFVRGEYSIGFNQTVRESKEVDK